MTDNASRTKRYRASGPGCARRQIQHPTGPGARGGYDALERGRHSVGDRARVRETPDRRDHELRREPHDAGRDRPAQDALTAPDRDETGSTRARRGDDARGSGFGTRYLPRRTTVRFPASERERPRSSDTSGSTGGQVVLTVRARPRRRRGCARRRESRRRHINAFCWNPVGPSEKKKTKKRGWTRRT